MFKKEYKDIFGRPNWKVWSNSENTRLIEQILGGADIHELTGQFGFESKTEDIVEIIRHCRNLKDLKRRFRRLGPEEVIFLERYHNRLIASDFSNIFNVSLDTVLSHAKKMGIHFCKKLRYERAKNKKDAVDHRRIEFLSPQDAVQELINYMREKEKGSNIRSISQGYIGFRRLTEKQQKAVLEYLVKYHFKITEEKLLSTKNKDNLINTKKLDEIDYTICMYYRKKQPRYPIAYQIFNAVYPGKTKFWDYRTYWNDELIAEALKESTRLGI
jgi:hypothetical protein